MHKEEKVAKEKKHFIEWVKEHKKGIKMTVIAVTLVVGAVLIAKNRKSIKCIFSPKRAVATVTNNFQVTNQIIPPTIPKEFFDDLTGNKLTPTNLGYKSLSSAQEINKRLVSKGLQTRLPCGEYALTETGKLLGEVNIKTTKAGHTFSNIEWDEKTIEILFTAQELQKIDKKSKIIQKVFSDNKAV